MNKKNLTLFFVIVMLLLIFSFNVFSFGISPAVKEYNYDNIKNNVLKGFVKIVNLHNETLNLLVFSDDDFVFSKNIVNINHSVKEVKINYTLPLNNLNEGENVFVIKIIPLNENKNFISSNTMLLSKVKVIKPYKNSFLKGRIDYYNKKVVIPIFNIGSKNTIANLRFEVFGNNNELIKSFYEKNFSIKKSSFVEKKFDLSFLDSGEYFLKATIFYDNNILELKKNIYLNTPTIRIINFSSKNFYYNSINKIILTIDNLWNKKLEDVYLNVNILNEDNVSVSNFKTQLFDLNPGLNNINLFFDFENFKDGTYTLIFNSFYIKNNKEYSLNKETFKLKYSYKGIFVDSLTPKVIEKKNKENTIVILVFFVILINILLLSVIFIKLKSFKK